MKLIYKIINKNRLFAKIIYIGFLFSLYANSAQITVIGPLPAGAVGVNPGNYVYNNIHWVDGRGFRLNTNTLQYHLLYTNNTQGANACIQELARILLAQIPAAGGIGLAGPHNVGGLGGNTNTAYTTAIKAGGGHNYDDIFLACDELKEHMLIHGHFGYFPMFSHEDHSGVSNHLIARGIFNISHTIIDRIFNFQLNIFKRINNFLNRSWYNRSYFWLPINVPVGHPMYNARYPGWVQINSSSFHLLPNLLNTLGFRVDPTLMGITLEDASNNLINHLLSTNHILNIVVSTVNKNRFTLDVTYNFPAQIPNITQTKDIGYNLNGNPTNTVKIVVQVQNGVISIVTMYPI